MKPTLPFLVVKSLYVSVIFFSVFTKHLTDQEGLSKNISHRLMGLTIWPPVCDVGCVGLERYGFAGGSMSLGSDFV